MPSTETTSGGYPRLRTLVDATRIVREGCSCDQHCTVSRDGYCGCQMDAEAILALAGERTFLPEEERQEFEHFRRLMASASHQAERWAAIEAQRTEKTSLVGCILALAAAARHATNDEAGTKFVLSHLVRTIQAAEATEKRD